MKKHLRLLYGADDRFQFVSETVKFCHEYFDTVRILNTGLKEFGDNFKNLPSNTTIENSTIFFGDLETTRWNFIKDVDINDWVLFLDADERPSEILLHNLDYIINDCEKNNYLKCRFPWLEHKTEQPNVAKYYSEMLKNSFPVNRIEWATPKANGMYARDVLIKKLFETHPVTNFGGHGGYSNTALYTVEYDNYFCFPINHYKSEVAIKQSLVLSTWFLSFININTNKQKEFIKTNPCFHKIVKFRKDNNVILQNDLVRRLKIDKDIELKNKLKNLLLEDDFKNAIDWYKVYYEWSHEFDCSLETPYNFCGLECCKYNNIQY